MKIRSAATSHILLAEDDDDDSMLFKEALNELPLNTDLYRVKDGVELMDFLKKKSNNLPDIIFLDINMPRKNGFECLEEIKKTDKLKNLPVIILSTSSGKEIVSKTYNAGANLYICKPNQFEHLKSTIQMAIDTYCDKYFLQPAFEDYMIRL